MPKFQKILSANDVGSTGTHQAGILVPKTDTALLGFLPFLSAEAKNPSAYLSCVDRLGVRFNARFVYYNNSLHDREGTRNEYRLTGLTDFLRRNGAKPGDLLEISGDGRGLDYLMEIVRPATVRSPAGPLRVRISSWSRVH